MRPILRAVLLPQLDLLVELVALVLLYLLLEAVSGDRILCRQSLSLFLHLL